MSDWFDAVSFIVFSFVCLSVFFPFILALFVYKDAAKNNIEPVWVWPLVVLFFSFFGVIAYIVARTTQPQIRVPLDEDQPSSKTKRSAAGIPKKASPKTKKGPITKY